MSLPNVNIQFANGALGSVVPSADGVVGVIAGKSKVVAAGDTAVFYGSDAFAKEDASYELAAFVKAFYTEAGEGAELWVHNLGMSPEQNTTAFEEAIPTLVEASSGRVRTVALCIDHAVSSIKDHAAAAQTGCEQALAKYRTPVVCLINIEDGSIDTAPALNTLDYDRVAVCWMPTCGTLAGRVAAVNVETHIGRVRDGALKSVTDAPYDNATAETLDNKGYITIRTYAGKGGCFFADDHMACSLTSDYHSLARRRVADKAYRCAYTVLMEYVNDNLPVTAEGHVTAMAAKAIEQEVEQYIYNSMTAEGNLSTDESNSTDKGVKVTVDTGNDFVATSTLNVTIRVKPYGYAKYIEVTLGFLKE